MTSAFAKVDFLDVQAGQLWDSLSYEAGSLMTSSNSQMFCIPIGQIGWNGQLKTRTDTNLYQSNRLPPPEQFTIQHVLFSFNRAALDEDVFRIAENAVWQLEIGSKIYASSLLISMRVYDNVSAPIRVCDYCRTVYVNDITCPGCGGQANWKPLDCIIPGPGSSKGVAGKQFMMDVNDLHLSCMVHFGVRFEGFDSLRITGPLKLWCHLEGQHAQGVQ